MARKLSALAEKVLILESWIEAGAAPDNAPRLKTIRDVRDWVDAEFGARLWSSDAVAAPSGKNARWRVRLDAVLPRLAALRGGTKSGTLTRPRRGVPVLQRQVEAERDRIASQVVTMMIDHQAERLEVARLRTLVSIMKIQLSDLEERNAELVKNMDRVVRLA